MTKSAPSGLEEVQPINIESEVSEVQLEAIIPKPVGYHILVAMPKVAETFGDSGLIKSAKTIHHDTILSMIGLVVDMGDQAYGDKERFPTGAWCELGDYVMFRTNSGTRFMVAGQEYRLLNDDSIEAVVEDPSGVKRVN
jgi:co-chaperonin GroES (HSP10)